MKTQTENSRMTTMMMMRKGLERNLEKAEGEETEAGEGVPGEEERIHMLRGAMGRNKPMLQALPPASLNN